MRIECLCFRKNGSAPVPGAVVLLTSERGQGRRTADINGRCIFRGLPEGTYTLRQFSAPDHLVKSDTVHRVTLNRECPCAHIGFASTPVNRRADT